jgi:hypothetical protein
LGFVICNFPDKPVPFWFRLVRAVDMPENVLPQLKLDLFNDFFRQHEPNSPSLSTKLKICLFSPGLLNPQNDQERNLGDRLVQTEFNP